MSKQKLRHWKDVPLENTRPNNQRQPGWHPHTSPKKPKGGITSEPVRQQQQPDLQPVSDYNKANVNQLFSEMREPSIPSYEGIWKSIKGKTVPQALEPFKQIGERRKAYNELKKRGFKDEDIKFLTQKDPSFWGQMWEDAPQIAGSMAGAAVGYKTKRPYLGSTVGAAIGGGLGKLGQEESRKYYAPEKAPKNIFEEVRNTAWAAGEEALAEFAGGQLYRGGKRLLAPARKYLKPDALRLSDDLSQAGNKIRPQDVPNYANKVTAKSGIQLTPAQMTANKFIDTVEEIVEGSFLGQQKLFRHKKALQPSAFNRWVDDVVDDIATKAGRELTDAQKGMLVAHNIKDGRATFKMAANQLYDNVDRVSRGAKVSLKNLKKTAKESLDNIAPKVKTPKGEKRLMSSLTSDTHKKLLKDVLDLPDKVPFSVLQDVRSRLNQIGYKTDEVIPGKTQGEAKHLINKIDEILSKPTKEMPKEAADALNKANKFWKAGKQKFNNKLTKKLLTNMEDMPEQVISDVFRPGRSAQINRVREMVDDNTWNHLKRGFVKKIVQDSRNEALETVSGDSFAKTLSKYGDDTLKSVFTSEEISRLKDIAKMGKMLQERTAGKGGMLIQLVQGGAVGGLLMGGLEPQAAAVLGAPEVVGRFLMSKTGHKLLTEGFKTPAGARGASSLTTRIIKGLIKTRQQIIKEKQNRKELIKYRQKNEKSERLLHWKAM